MRKNSVGRAARHGSSRVCSQHRARRSVTLYTLLQLCATVTTAADLSVTVVDGHDHGVEGVVLVAEPDNAAAIRRAPRVAVMDQINMQFVPEIVVIQTGSSVDFPNSDQIQHQVYSFSAPKKFQLSLYQGHKYPPVLFDRPGLVTVGCNIHDGMLGYIYVTDSPFFGKSDAHGQLLLRDLPVGSYLVTAWHPELPEGGSHEPQQLRVNVTEPQPASVVFHLEQPMHTSMQHHESKKWVDY
jgi:plastocyanin